MNLVIYGSRSFLCRAILTGHKCYEYYILLTFYFYRVFSHDVTVTILVCQNNEMAAMLVSQTSPLGVELFSYANAFISFAPINLHRCWPFE